MKNIQGRMILYTKDVMQLMGRGERTSRNILASIKKKKGTPYVDVEAFCEYSKLREEKVREFLANS